MFRTARELVLAQEIAELKSQLRGGSLAVPWHREMDLPSMPQQLQLAQLVTGSVTEDQSALRVLVRARGTGKREFGLNLYVTDTELYTATDVMNLAGVLGQRLLYEVAEAIKQEQTA
jgi:hypothetical protein